MKKLVALVLAAVLMMSVSLALAEEGAAVRGVTESPSVYFGADWHDALETFNNGWKSTGQYSYSDTPENEARTLADGTSVFVMTLPGVPDEKGYAMQMTAKLYFIDDKLVAAVQELPVPEGRDASAYKETLNFVMGTTPVPLDTNAKIGNALEVVGEDAHLEDGQDTWIYEVSVPTYVEGNLTYVTVNAMMTAHVVDNTLYVAEFPYQKAGTSAAAQNLAEIEGYDKLTAEEQNAAQLYAEFLQKMQKETLKDYINFLLTKHQ